jgi:hypothetical protein
VWGDVKEATAWGRGLEPSGFDDGPYWQLKLKPSANHVGVLVYKGDSTKGEEKAAGEARGGGWEIDSHQQCTSHEAMCWEAFCVTAM